LKRHFDIIHPKHVKKHAISKEEPKKSAGLAKKVEQKKPDLVVRKPEKTSALPKVAAEQDMFAGNVDDFLDNSIEQTKVKETQTDYSLRTKEKLQETKIPKNPKKPFHLKPVYFLPIVLAIVFAFLGLFAFRVYNQTLTLAVEGKNRLSLAEHFFSEKKYDKAITNLESANKSLANAQKKISFFRAPLNIAASLSPNLKNNLYLFDAAYFVSQAGVGASAAYNEFLGSFGNGNWEKFLESQIGNLEKIDSNLTLAKENIEKLNPALLGKKDQESVKALKKALLEAKLFSEAGALFAKNKNQYLNASILVLLPNNNEMQLAGGFTGSFGIIDLKEGKISALNVYDVYKLDNAYQAATGKDDMFLRNVTKISPDFEVVAQEAVKRYNAEAKNAGLEEKNFQAVLAITPTVLEDIIGVIGPIDLLEYGLVLDKTNVTIELEKQVENGADKKVGVNPKGILDVFGKKLISKLEGTNTTKKLELANLVVKSSSQKQVLAYFPNEKFQKLVSSAGISGNIKTQNSDYFLAAQENIGGGKSSLAVKNSYTYDLSKVGEDWVVDLTISRNHTSNYFYYYYDVKQKVNMWLIGVNTNRTNLYVPKGAQVLESTNIDKVDVAEKDNKTVFSFWSTVAPKQEKIFKIKYKLPANVFQTSNAKAKYELLIQKQIGSVGDEFNFLFHLPSGFDPVGLPDGFLREGNDIKHNAFLDTDKLIKLEFE